MKPIEEEEVFLGKYQPSELKIASEFLTTWLPFLSRDLCNDCAHLLSDRIRSLDPETVGSATMVENEEAEEIDNNNNKSMDDDCDVKFCDFHSLGSLKAAVDIVRNEVPSQSTVSMLASPIMAGTDMALEDGLKEDEKKESELAETPEKRKLSREEREQYRFMNVKRMKVFSCFERVRGERVNILEGLELHTGVFSAVEQKRIVDHVYELQEKGLKGELRERTFTAPHKWMRGKGRVTIQFGCCYNYATDKAGNPPGILKHGAVDPIPSLFKVIIRRLIGWHVLPPTCVPDSCIVNIYDEGDCIPPHIDNHDFLRPFCTVSFLSECDILFGSNLKIVGPGEFSGSYSIPLPVGSVLVLKGNGADVAKHCVPAVPTKRISITFRKMDESKRPFGFTPEPDLQGIKPLPYEQTTPASAPAVAAILQDQTMTKMVAITTSEEASIMSRESGYHSESGHHHHHHHHHQAKELESHESRHTPNREFRPKG